MIRKPAQSRLQKRATARLSFALDKRLLAYASAASAAGIGLFIAQPAEAEIVYTAADLPIPYNTGALGVDLNHDGIADFGFYGFFSNLARRHVPEGFSNSGLIALGYQAGNEIWTVESKGSECAAVLPKGAKIGGAGQAFQQEVPLFDAAASYTRGRTEHCKWGAQHRGAFLGLKFVVNGQTHYGWAHITVNGRASVLNGYAYETVPNKAILAGTADGPVKEAASILPKLDIQPATLSLLARGERGLAIWRKTDEQEAAIL